MGEFKYIKVLITKIKELVDSSTIITGDFNTPLTSRDRLSKQSREETMALNDTLDQTY